MHFFAMATGAGTGTDIDVNSNDARCTYACTCALAIGYIVYDHEFEPGLETMRWQSRKTDGPQNFLREATTGAPIVKLGTKWLKRWRRESEKTASGDAHDSPVLNESASMCPMGSDDVTNETRNEREDRWTRQ